MSEFNMRVEERIAMWRREYVTVERVDENEVQDSTFEIFQDDSDSLLYTNNPTTKCL